MKKLLLRLFGRPAAPASAPDPLDLPELRLGPDDLAIDCGANVGRVTARLAEGGARVYAFEPHPDAFRALRERFADNPRVVCIEKAVHDRAGTARLHFHRESAEDPLKWSTGSSLDAGKRNVDPENFATVETVDLAEFVLGLGRRVALLKIDVEGVEVEILNRLLDTGAVRLVDRVLVETHERKMPNLVEPVARLRRRLAEEGLADIVRLDWV